MFYVYVLQSLKNGRLYIGSTNNLERRLFEHNNGQSKYTRYATPFELIYKEEYETKSEAYKREMFFKTGRGRDKLSRLLKMRE